MKDYKKIEKSLNKLHNDFNLQLNALGNDSVQFHDAIIELTAKYPEHKDLLHFIVHINDKLETNHTLFSEIFIDSFNDLIRIKQNMLDKIMDENEIDKDTTGFWKKTLKMATNIKDTKVLMMYIAVIIAIGGAIFAPAESLAILKAITKIIV